MSISKIKEINKNIWTILQEQFVDKDKDGEWGTKETAKKITQQILSLIEELEKEKELSGYGGTLAIEGSAEICQLGKNFNRLTIEKIIQKKINRAIEELEGKIEEMSGITSVNNAPMLGDGAGDNQQIMFFGLQDWIKLKKTLTK